MAAKMQSFKLKNAGECRRFRLPVDDHLFSSLTHQVRTLYGLTGDVNLFYFDEEKDRIEVDSQIELEAAIFSFPNLLVLEIETSTEKEKEKEKEVEQAKEEKVSPKHPGFGRGRGGRGCGRGGWKKWRTQMEGATDEERQEMWNQRKIEMLKWKLERLNQKLAFVDEKIKENDQADKWIVKQTVLHAKKGYVEQRIAALTNGEDNTANTTTTNNINNGNKWGKMRGQRLRFKVALISASLDSLRDLERSTEKKVDNDTLVWKINKLEDKKACLEKKIERIESGEDKGCGGGGRWGHKHGAHHHHQHQHQHQHQSQHGDMLANWIQMMSCYVDNQGGSPCNK